MPAILLYIYTRFDYLLNVALYAFSDSPVYVLILFSTRSALERLFSTVSLDTLFPQSVS